MGKNGYMNWDEIKEIDKSELGFIGHHSHTHEYLIDMNEKDFIKDIEKASNIFKNNLLLQLAKNESISYKTINSSGFPTQIQTNINEFEIINSRNDMILIESKAIQLSIHPFDLSKVALKSNLISILVNKDNVVFDIDMNSILSVIFVDQNNLHNLNSAINNIKIANINVVSNTTKKTGNILLILLI